MTRDKPVAKLGFEVKEAFKPSRQAVVSTLSVVAGLFFLAACGSCGSSSTGGGSSTTPRAESSPTSSSGTTYSNVDACKLVTAGDASTAVGTTVANAAGAAAFPGACFYTSSDGTAIVLVFAQVEPNASAAASVDPNQITAAFASVYGIKNAHAVSGIGDKAFEYSATSSVSSSNGIAIFVFKANVLIFIVMSPSTDSGKIESLARTAVSRLS